MMKDHIVRLGSGARRLHKFSGGIILCLSVILCLGGYSMFVDLTRALKCKVCLAVYLPIHTETKYFFNIVGVYIRGETRTDFRIFLEKSLPDSGIYVGGLFRCPNIPRNIFWPSEFVIFKIDTSTVECRSPWVYWTTREIFARVRHWLA